MAKRKLLKVLFFLSGAAPSTEELAAIGAFGEGHTVCQRNALHINEADPIEDFDLVAGAVPTSYAEAAEAKGEPPVYVSPKTPIASLQPDSPLAPADAKDDRDDAGADAGQEDAGKPAEAVQDAASEPEAGKTPAPAPKAPEAKPAAGKAWKPNS